MVVQPKKYRGKKNQINILFYMQTESIDTRPSRTKKYRGEKNKINILLCMQTESNDGRPSRRFSTSSSPFYGELRKVVKVDDQCHDVSVGF